MESNSTQEGLTIKIGEYPSDFRDVIEYLLNNKILIYLEGLISGGKTSLGRSIDKVCTKYGINYNLYLEPINSKNLELFYSDPVKYAFSFQSIVIRDRIHVNEDAIQELLQQDHGIVFIDRSRFGDCAFGIMHHVKKNMNDAEFAVYIDLIKSDRLDKYSKEFGLKSKDKIKDFVVYLLNTPEKSRERVIKRGNPTEIKNCTIEYLSDLEDNYVKVLCKKPVNSLEETAITEVYKNYKNTVLFIDYDKDLKIDNEGFIDEYQVLEILSQLVQKIKHECC